MRPEVLSALYGHHVDVLHVHGRILVVAGPGADDEELARPPALDRRLSRLTVHWLFEPGFFSSAPGATARCVIGARGRRRVGGRRRVHRLTRPVLRRPRADRRLHRRRLGRAPARAEPAHRLPRPAGSSAPGRWSDRRRSGRAGRDLATGIVLGAATGLAALFLYLDTTTRATTGATQQILFGSIFIDRHLDRSPTWSCSASLAFAVLAVLYRPLLLSSVSPDIARPGACRSGWSGSCSCSPWRSRSGSRRSPSGPSCRPRCSSARRPPPCGSPGGIGAAHRGGRADRGRRDLARLLLAYDSYYWGSSQNGWPVSFFIVAVIFVATCLGLPRARWRRRRAT